jgi:predicted RNA binding protein YcfA (HicA-like mRNA interferase family)
MKLPILSSSEIERVLHRAGFKPAPKRGKGSHKAFVKETKNKKFLVIVPQKKTIPRGTLLAIIKQAGLTKEEFMRLLKE